MKRSVFRHAHRWASIAVVLAFVVLVNYLGGKYWTQADVTSARFHSLAPQTLEELQRLDAPLEIVTLFSPESADVAPRVFDELRAVLRSVAESRPELITLKEHDPLREPARVESLLGGGAFALARPINVVLVEMGERTREIDLEDMIVRGDSARLTRPAPVRALSLEGELFEALIDLSRRERPVVRFAQGHGEVAPGGASGRTSCAEFVAALERRGLAVESWNALGAEGASVPAETALLVVAGPRVTWGPTEARAVDAYLEEGGRLLLLIEPVANAEGDSLIATGLEESLARFGVALPTSLVLDPGAPLVDFGPEVFYALVLPGHPIAERVANQPLIFNLARPLRAETRPGTDLQISVLAESTEQAWGEREIASLASGATPGENDEPSPLSLALAARAGRDPFGEDARVVVVGDANPVTDETFSLYAHRPFLLSAADWLIERDTAPRVRPRERRLSQLFLSARDRAWLTALALAVMPVMTLIAGLAVRRLRRR